MFSWCYQTPSVSSASRLRSRHDHVIVRQRVEVLVHFLADCALCFGHDSIPSPVSSSSQVGAMRWKSEKLHRAGTRTD